MRATNPGCCHAPTGKGTHIDRLQVLVTSCISPAVVWETVIVEASMTSDGSRSALRLPWCPPPNHVGSRIVNRYQLDWIAAVAPQGHVFEPPGDISIYLVHWHVVTNTNNFKLCKRCWFSRKQRQADPLVRPKLPCHTSGETSSTYHLYPVVTHPILSLATMELCPHHPPQSHLLLPHRRAPSNTRFFCMINVV